MWNLNKYYYYIIIIVCLLIEVKITSTRPTELGNNLDNQLKQFGAMGSEEDWRTQSFRQSVITKIEKEIQRSGMQVARNSSEMENYIFMNAESREEYMIMVARLVLHIREISLPKPNQGPNMQGPNQNQQSANTQVQTQQGQQQPGAGDQSGHAPDSINMDMESIRSDLEKVRF